MESTATACASCGFPARATPIEVDRAVAEFRQHGRLAEIGVPIVFFGLLPWWRKGLIVVALVLLAIGWCLALFAGPIPLNWIGVGLAVAGLTLLYLSGARKSDT